MCVLRKFRLKVGAKYGTKEVGSWIVDYIKKSIEIFIGFFTENQKVNAIFTSDSLFFIG